MTARKRFHNAFLFVIVGALSAALSCLIVLGSSGIVPTRIDSSNADLEPGQVCELRELLKRALDQDGYLSTDHAERIEVLFQKLLPSEDVMGSGYEWEVQYTAGRGVSVASFAVILLPKGGNWFSDQLLRIMITYFPDPEVVHTDQKFCGYPVLRGVDGYNLYVGNFSIYSRGIVEGYKDTDVTEKILGSLDLQLLENL